MTNRQTAGTDDAPAGETAFQAARWSLTEQFRAIEGLDAKAERLFAAALAIVGLFGAVVTFTVDRGQESTAITALLIGLPVVSTFAYAAFAFLRGHRISEWNAGPPGNAMLEVAGQHPEARVRLWLAEELVRSYDENLEPLNAKTKWFHRALLALYLELAFALAGIAVVAVVEFAARR